MRTLDIQFAPPLKTPVTKGSVFPSKASCSQFPHLVDQFEAKTDPSNIDEFSGNSEGLGL